MIHGAFGFSTELEPDGLADFEVPDEGEIDRLHAIGADTALVTACWVQLLKPSFSTRTL